MSGPHRPGSEGCREYFALLSEYLDSELDETLCGQFDSHMSDCPPCQEFLESLRRTVGLLGRLPRQELGEDEKRRILEACEKLRGKG